METWVRFPDSLLGKDDFRLLKSSFFAIYLRKTRSKPNPEGEAPRRGYVFETFKKDAISPESHLAGHPLTADPFETHLVGFQSIAVPARACLVGHLPIADPSGIRIVGRVVACGVVWDTL